MNTSQKFSLVELLVVLTIIALLSAVLIPSIIKSRQQATKTACMSNLKQLGISAKLYLQEQGYYPDAYFKLKGSIVKYWCYEYDGYHANFTKGAMADYIQNHHLLKCPSFFNYKSIDPDKNFTSSYGINAEYVGGTPSVETEDLEAILNSAPAKAEQIKRPETTIIFADSAKVSEHLTESCLIWGRYSYTFGIDLDPTTHFRHNFKTIAVFCDGHIQDDLTPDAISSTHYKIGWLDRYILERK